MNRFAHFRTVLRNRNARLLLSASVASLLGDWFAFVALSFLLYRLGGVGAVGALNIVRVALALVVTPVAGRLADRLSRRTIMIASDICLAGVSLTIAGLVFADSLGLPIVFALVIVGGLAGSAFRPARLAIVPSVVDPQQWAAMNALDGTAGTFAVAVGPGLAGILAAPLGSGGLFLVNALTFLVSALCSAGLRLPDQDRAGGEKKEGSAPQSACPVPEERPRWTDTVRESLRDRRIRAALGTHVASHFAVGATLVGVVVLAGAVFQDGQAGTGYLTSAIGLGSMAGMVLGGCVGRHGLSIAALSAIVLGAAVVAFGMSTGPLMSLATCLSMGLFANVLEAPIWTAYQLATPEDRMGSVFGAIDTTTTVSIAAGATLASALIRGGGLGLAMGLAGVAVGTGGVLSLLASRRAERLPLDPVPVEARSNIDAHPETLASRTVS